MLASVLPHCGVLPLDCVVQKICYDARHKCLRGERDVDHIIELPFYASGEIIIFRGFFWGVGSNEPQKVLRYN